MSQTQAYAVPSQTQIITNKTIPLFDFKAPQLEPNETNSASFETLSGVNIKQRVGAFNDTTQEYLNGSFTIRPDITATTLVLSAYVMAKIAVASKNVALDFDWYLAGTGEDFDGALTTVSSGDKAIDGTQDNITIVQWNVTWSTLSAADLDLVFFRLSRKAASADNLADDMYLFRFRGDLV